MILMTALLLAACTEAEAPKPDVAAPVAEKASAASPDQVVTAERAFAAEAAARGWIEAYETWADDEGFVLQNGPERAKAFAANIHPGVRGDTTLHWAPAFAGISAAGDFGFTAGPFSGDGAAFGHYLTVWRKTPAGEWRWLFEGGVDVRTPTQPEAATAAFASAPEVGEGSAQAGAAAVKAEEDKLATAADANARGALAERMAATARVQRMDAEPAGDVVTIGALLAHGPERVRYRNLRVDASAAGDMAFAMGEARWDGGSGYYQRLWVKTAAGWRIVFDQVLVRVLPPM